MLLGLVCSPFANADGELSEPYKNPGFANSAYSETHYLAHFTSFPGPVDATRRLSDTEIQWKPTGPVTWTPLFSSPYPNGQTVIWTGAHDRIAKVDAQTLETLAEYKNEEYDYYEDSIIQSHLDELGKLEGLARADYYWEVFKPALPNFLGFYRVLSAENELYLPYQYKDGPLVLRAYGETDPTNPASGIVVKREWVVPEHLATARLYATTLTSNGEVIVGFSDGKLVALSKDFSSQNILQLPRHDQDALNNDVFAAFMRNGITVDEGDGIYVVTRDYFHRVQWTGEKLSLNETDRAWTAKYPNSSGLGSGTTPALMGWGGTEDRLVLIADGSKKNNDLLAFWRGEIPENWEGIPGYDRRVAGVEPVQFNAGNETETRVENSIVVFGYGAFLVSSQPSIRFTGQGSPQKQAIKEFLSTDFNEMRGGTMIRWDAKKRSLATAWRNPTNFATSICAVSGATEIVYCWGARDGEWTMEAIEWKTGESSFYYLLGSSPKFNVFGGMVVIAPDGAIVCGCGGGLGLVRIEPKFP